MKVQCQLWRQCKEWLSLTTTKTSICWSLAVYYQTWPTFAYTYLQMQTAIPSRKQIKTFWWKIEKILLVDYLSCLHVMQSLTKLWFGNRQTYANLLSGLMPANYIHIWCVSPCGPVFIRVGSLIQKPAGSNFVKARPAALKLWSCPIVKELELIVELETSIQQAGERKLTGLVLMGFVLIATLCLKPRVASTTLCFAKKCVHPLVKKKTNVAVRCIELTLITWERFHCYWIVGMQMTGTVQNN